MNIQQYTTVKLTDMAHELNLDLHDSALPYILARHIYTMEIATTSSDNESIPNCSPIDYESILIHIAKSLK